MQNNYAYPQQNYMNYQQPPVQMYPNNNPHNNLLNTSLNINNPNMINPPINSMIHHNPNQKVPQNISN
jgi:hypothetical protein